MTTQRDEWIREGEAALDKTLEHLEGQWIAVRHFKVVDHADTLEELLDRVGDEVDRIFQVKALPPPIPFPSR